MKTKIYVLFDKMSCELNPRTFNAPNDDVAKRIIVNSFFKDDGTLNNETIRNAKHFTLVHLGDYDTESGISGLGNNYRTVCEMAEITESAKKELANKDEPQDKAE